MWEGQVLFIILDMEYEDQNYMDPSEEAQEMGQVLEGNSSLCALSKKLVLLCIQGTAAKRTLCSGGQRGTNGHSHLSMEFHLSR